VGLGGDHQRHGGQATTASAETAGAGHGSGRVGLDGEERIDTVALGWNGQHVYVRMADARCRTRAIWLDAADVTRR
jgi:hypothetical protein